ncbi:hypothetical protein [Streptomyces sp. NPDC058092]|uniref:hypothetical protein n=1 Tax=Streptomyces sp. NPDC058092 TaxID=3346336 RepID=UPI0036DFC277
MAYLEHEVFPVHRVDDVVILEGQINGSRAADWQDIPGKGKRMALQVAVRQLS